MAEEPEFLGDKKEKKKSVFNKYGGLIIFGIALVVIIIGFTTRQTPQVSKDCCDLICGKLGTNVTCVGRTINNEVICKMSYGRFGMPEISEQFSFKVENLTKACAPREITPVIIPQNQSIKINSTRVVGDNQTQLGGAA